MIRPAAIFTAKQRVRQAHLLTNGLTVRVFRFQDRSESIEAGVRRHTGIACVGDQAYVLKSKLRSNQKGDVAGTLYARLFRAYSTVDA